MASFMASRSPANPDLPCQSSIHSQSISDDDHINNFGSMVMDEFLKNMYDDAEAFHDDNGAADHDDGCGDGGVSLSPSKSKTVDEVWKEIVAGSGGGIRQPEMTLEDFLTKAGAVTEEDVKFPVMPPPPPPVGFSVDSMMNSTQFHAPTHIQSSQNVPGGIGDDSVGFGNGIDGRMVAFAGSGGGGGGVVGRGKRRLVEEPPLDKATQQKQRRMIKNRESAARSRERKQAYTVELEASVTQLEEENARLERELEEEIKKAKEKTKERFKQLMETLIPVVEKRRPPRLLRRVQSMYW